MSPVAGLEERRLIRQSGCYRFGSRGGVVYSAGNRNFINFGCQYQSVYLYSMPEYLMQGSLTVALLRFSYC
jgi:hypothetical protein